MWLSGGAKPDHNTINDFRGKRLGGCLKKIFNQVVVLLSEQGAIKEIVLDGTKIEADKLQYNEQSDTYTCPLGQPMRYIGQKTSRTKTGYLQTHRRYQAQNCTGCPMRGPCHKARGARIIERSPNLMRSKQRVRELLNSEVGIEKRKQWQVEAVFGNLKQNKGFRRFSLRGIDKTTTEFGLIALAHNLQRFSSNH